MFQGVQGSYRHHGPRIVAGSNTPAAVTFRHLLYIQGEPWVWEAFDRVDDFHDWWPFLYTPEFLRTTYFEAVEIMDKTRTEIAGRTMQWPTSVRLLKHGDQIGLLQRYIGTRRGLDTW